MENAGTAFSIIAVVIAIASFAGTILSNYVNYRSTIDQQISHHKELRREHYLAFLEKQLNELIEIRSTLQYLHGKVISAKEEREREEAYGKAFALMQSVPDDEIRGIANKIMTESNPSLKLQAIDQLIMKMGSLVHNAIMASQ